jgi:transcriptional regulator with XRE-family HTH domain
MISRPWMRRERAKRDWTQAEAASQLGLSQAYLSMLEAGRRPISRHLAATLGQFYELPPTAIAPRENASGDPAVLDGELADLGYELFGGRGTDARVNPAELLLSALRHDDLEMRITEALPWVALTYPEMDWDWLVPRAKVDDLQNRLGFIVTLARELAQKQDDEPSEAALFEQEQRLSRSLLSREDTLCQQSMGDAERSWLRNHRPVDAARWHLLTSMTTGDLPYAVRDSHRGRHDQEEL